jgi:hypothetical protein
METASLWRPVITAYKRPPRIGAERFRFRREPKRGVSIHVERPVHESEVYARKCFGIPFFISSDFGRDLPLIGFLLDSALSAAR